MNTSYLYGNRSLNSSFFAVTADYKSRWPQGRKGYFHGVAVTVSVLFHPSPDLLRAESARQSQFLFTSRVFCSVLQWKGYWNISVCVTWLAEQSGAVFLKPQRIMKLQARKSWVESPKVFHLERQLQWFFIPGSVSFYRYSTGGIISTWVSGSGDWATTSYAPTISFHSLLYSVTSFLHSKKGKKNHQAKARAKEVLRHLWFSLS